MIHCVYLLCLASIVTATAYIDNSDENKGINIFEMNKIVIMPYRTADLLERFVRKSSLACPIIVVGEQCPEETPLYYYRCCGDLNSSCCFRLQEWVFVVLVIMGVLIIGSLVLNFIRCLFCVR